MAYLVANSARLIALHSSTAIQSVAPHFGSQRFNTLRQSKPNQAISRRHHKPRITSRISTTQQTNPPHIVSLRSITLLGCSSVRSRSQHSIAPLVAKTARTKTHLDAITDQIKKAHCSTPSHRISVQIASRRHYTPHQHITLLVAMPQHFVAVLEGKSKRNGSPRPTPRRQLTPIRNITPHLIPRRQRSAYHISSPARSASQHTTSRRHGSPPHTLSSHHSKSAHHPTPQRSTHHILGVRPGPYQRIPRRHLRTFHHMARQISKSGHFATIHGMSHFSEIAKV